MSTTTPSYTTEQLVNVAKVYVKNNCNRAETENLLKSLKLPDELITASLDEIQRQENVANAPQTAVAVEEPPQEPEEKMSTAVDDAEAAPDEITDEEIQVAANKVVSQTDVFANAVKGLLELYDIPEDEAKDFIGRAFEDARWEEKQHADKMQEAAGLARDKELAAAEETTQLFVDNFCLKMNKKKPTTPEEYEKYAKLIRRQLDKEAAKEAAELKADDKEVTDKFPECPKLPGVLSDLASAMFPSLPFEFKQAALFTHFGLLRSGIDTFGMEPHLQPRFYTVMVSLPNVGKTASINETRNAMEIINTRTKMLADAKPRVCSTPDLIASADSGQFLVENFVQVGKESKRAFEMGGCADLAAKVLLDPDELSDVFEKARTSQGRVSTLFIEMLKLHSSNRTGSGTKTSGKMKVENAHLAVLAGTTTRKYPMLWTGTGGGADGLRSRFIPITTNNPPVPPQPLLSDVPVVQAAYERIANILQMPGQNIQLSEDAAALLQQWWYSFDNTKDAATRVLEFVKQLLTVLAVTNTPENHQGRVIVVGSKLVKVATTFGDYVIEVRERLNPGDAWTHVQAMENAIILWSKQTSKTNPGSMRDCRRVIHPERLPGGLGTFKLAWKNCIDTEMLKWVCKDGKSDRYSR